MAHREREWYNAYKVPLCTEQSGTLYGAKGVLYTEQSDAVAHDDVDDDGCTDEGGDGVEGNFP